MKVEPAPAGSVEAGAGGPARERHHARSTAKHSAVYLVGTALSRLAGFIMLPLYTRVLSTSEYGVLELLGYTTDVITMLAGLGIGTAVTRYFYRYDSDDERNLVVSSAALLLLGLFALVAVVGFAFAGPLAQAVLGPPDPALPESPLTYMRLAIIVLALGVAIEFPLLVLRTRQRSVDAVVSGLARLLLALTLNVVLVVGLRMGVAGVLLSTIIASSTVGAVLLYRMFRESGWRFDPVLVRQLIAFGAPLVIWELGSFVLHFSNRYFLRVHHSFGDVGLFSLSYKFSQVMLFLVTGPFGAVWLPKALEIVRQEGEAATPILESIQRQYALVLVTAALGMTLFSYDMIRVVAGPDFRSAADIVPILSVGMLFFGLRQIAQVGVIAKDRPGLVALGTTIAAGCALVLNQLLIPTWGAFGAAIATVGGFGIEFFLLRWYSMRLFPVRVYWGAAPLLIAAAIWGATQLVLGPDTALVASLLLNALALGTFVALLFVTGIIPPDQRRALLAAARDPLGALRALRAA